jgi:predicted CoA-substrate-specific enzyme activase
VTIVLGIDIGSSHSKGLLWEDRRTLASFHCPSGGDFRLTAETIREALLTGSRLSSGDISYTVATGFGSGLVAYADAVKTDVSCHAKGIFHLSPAVHTVIDVGDLYSKVLKTDGQGNVVNFVLSGKCAGGSGRILQIIAKVLQVKIEEIGPLSLKSKNRVEFNTGCVVFAESEAVSRIAEGASKEDLLAGIHRALAGQLHSLAERLTIEDDLALVGGGARDSGLVKALEEVSGRDVVVPPEPHMTAALGAALFAGEALET